MYHNHCIGIFTSRHQFYPPLVKLLTILQKGKRNPRLFGAKDKQTILTNVPFTAYYLFFFVAVHIDRNLFYGGRALQKPVLGKLLFLVICSYFMTK